MGLLYQIIKGYGTRFKTFYLGLSMIKVKGQVQDYGYWTTEILSLHNSSSTFNGLAEALPTLLRTLSWKYTYCQKLNISMITNNIYKILCISRLIICAVLWAKISQKRRSTCWCCRQGSLSANSITWVQLFLRGVFFPLIIQSQQSAIGFHLINIHMEKQSLGAPMWHHRRAFDTATHVD